MPAIDPGKPTPVRATKFQHFRDLQEATTRTRWHPWEIAIIKIDRDSRRGVGELRLPRRGRPVAGDSGVGRRGSPRPPGPRRPISAETRRVPRPPIARTSIQRPSVGSSRRRARDRSRDRRVVVRPRTRPTGTARHRHRPWADRRRVRRGQRRSPRAQPRRSPGRSRCHCRPPSRGCYGGTEPSPCRGSTAPELLAVDRRRSSAVARAGRSRLRPRAQRSRRA